MVGTACSTHYAVLSMLGLVEKLLGCFFNLYRCTACSTHHAVPSMLGLVDCGYVKSTAVYRVTVSYADIIIQYCYRFLQYCVSTKFHVLSFLYPDYIDEIWLKIFK